jgi:hypothetical protein
MKDGRTHLAHKAEHAVDMETGAIVGVTVVSNHVVPLMLLTLTRLLGLCALRPMLNTDSD